LTGLLPAYQKKKTSVHKSVSTKHFDVLKKKIKQLTTQKKITKKKLNNIDRKISPKKQEFITHVISYLI
jgi:chaperonin cofactor prefoldin